MTDPPTRQRSPNPGSEEVRRTREPEEPELYAVVGRPVLHSLSPQLFDAAFRTSGRDAFYIRLCADSAKKALLSAEKLGCRALNVTAPFKRKMYELADEAGTDAAALGAANTLIREGGYWRAENTDPAGVCGALHACALGKRLSACSVAVIGAGGAAAAALAALDDTGATVTVHNRTLRRAEALAAQFGCNAKPLRSDALARTLRNADVLILCVSAREPVVPQYLFAPKNSLTVIDARYPTSPELVAARDAGCSTIDGRVWLYHQAVAAYTLMTEEEPPTEMIRETLQRTHPPAHLQRAHTVALIGYMGAGKSTVARILAKRRGLPVIDTDEVVARRTGRSIGALFATHGEPAFRRYEREVILALIKERSLTPAQPLRPQRIIALGGGAGTDAELNRAVAQRWLGVWLYASHEACMRRVEPGTRPLLTAENTTRSHRQRYLRRQRGYAACAALVVDTDEASAETVAEMIDDELDRAIGD